MIDLSQLPMGSLFSGVGGIDLGLEWAGVGRTVWQVEIDEWCSGVLALRFPHAKRYRDVRRVGGARSAEHLERVAIICGGFPCQDLSVAGKGEGIEGARSGMWFEMLRIVRELQPLVVVIENVAALASRGLDIVAGGLIDAGYDVEARIIAAADVGAPHRRERLFVVGILADTRSARREGTDERQSQFTEPARRDPIVADTRDDRRAQLGAGHDDDGRDARRQELDGCDPRVADTERGRLWQLEQWLPARRSRSVCDGREAEPEHERESGRGCAQSRLGGGDHGLPDRVDRWPARPGDAPALWEPARAVTSRSPTRALRVHALGNACVPQCLAPVAARIRERLGA